MDGLTQRKIGQEVDIAIGSAMEYYSRLSCCLPELWPCLKQIVEEHRNSFPNDIYNLITNMGLKCSIEENKDILHPICVALDNMQSSSATLSDAVIIWSELCKDLNEKLSVDKQKMLADRRKMNLTPAHFLSFYLDPKYCDEKVLNVDEQNSALELASETDPRLLTVIAQYRGKAAPLLKPFYDTAKSVSAKDCWNILDIDQDLKEIIQGFLTCNPSTAPLERLFSTYGWIHDEHRNRMSNKKASKLLFCFKTLNKTID